MEFQSTISEKADKFETFFKQSPSWSIWYELPIRHLLSILLSSYGLLEIFLEALKSDDPVQSLVELTEMDKVLKDPFENADDDEIGMLIGMFYALDFNMHSVGIFSKFLNQLIEEGREEDEFIFDAVLVDQTALASPTVAKRIQKAIMQDDKSFFDSLAKAITKTRPRRPEKELDDTRFLLAIINEFKPLSQIPPKQIYDVLTKELKAYPSIDNNTYETFRRFYHRHKKSIGT